MRLAAPAACAVALATLAAGAPAAVKPLVRFDLRRPAEARAWTADHDIAALRPGPDGLAVEIAGSDPYLHGPACSLPASAPVWLRLRLKAPAPGMAQVFWFTASKPASETNSVRVPVRGGAWTDVRLPLPPLGPRTRFRIDPPGDSGTVTLSLLEVEARRTIREPSWPVPPAPNLRGARALTAGPLVLRHGPALGAFEAAVDGRRMARGNPRALLGYEAAGRARWLDLSAAKATVTAAAGSLAVRATLRDPDGGAWTFSQRFRSAGPGAIGVEARISCTVPRDVFYLPVFTLLPGAGSFGARKHQAVFPGVEYLDAGEPSSSEKDVTGPGARRKVPALYRVTIPMMAVEDGGRSVGLVAERRPDLCLAFDSPDRTLRSGGHLVSVLFPGSDGASRDEGSLVPYAPRRLPAAGLTARVTIVGAVGDSVVPAIRRAVEMRGLPPLPTALPSHDAALAAAAAGWLDSKIRVDGAYRHAFPGSFTPQPAADAALWMDWLAGRAGDAALAGRLAAAARDAEAAVPADRRAQDRIGHVGTPAPALLYGDVRAAVANALAAGRAALARFSPDGTVTYRPRPGEADLGRTHFARHANGLTAASVVAVLEAAALTGDPGLRSEGVRLARALRQYRHSVPRGAQTWEVPLHTPDILASANLVRAFTLASALSGDRSLLDDARYWAWTGVPFVYLDDPVPQPVGRYATIAVYGASNWVAPNWIGLPVQWCGLVYADALYGLADADPSGPWRRLADGIAASGVQQAWPAGSDPARQGLLPDSFNLPGQVRNDPGINPATLLPEAARLYGLPAPYGFHAFPKGPLVHAPGAITDARISAAGVDFTVHGWSKGDYAILLSGLEGPPAGATVNGAAAKVDYDPALRIATVRAGGVSRVVVSLSRA